MKKECSLQKSLKKYNKCFTVSWILFVIIEFVAILLPVNLGWIRILVFVGAFLAFFISFFVFSYLQNKRIERVYNTMDMAFIQSELNADSSEKTSVLVKLNLAFLNGEYSEVVKYSLGLLRVKKSLKQRMYGYYYLLYVYFLLGDRKKLQPIYDACMKEMSKHPHKKIFANCKKIAEQVRVYLTGSDEEINAMKQKFHVEIPTSLPVYLQGIRRFSKGWMLYRFGMTEEAKAVLSTVVEESSKMGYVVYAKAFLQAIEDNTEPVFPEMMVSDDEETLSGIGKKMEKNNENVRTSLIIFLSLFLFYCFVFCIGYISPHSFSSDIISFVQGQASYDEGSFEIHVKINGDTVHIQADATPDGLDVFMGYPDENGEIAVNRYLGTLHPDEEVSFEIPRKNGKMRKLVLRLQPNKRDVYSEAAISIQGKYEGKTVYLRLYK